MNAVDLELAEQLVAANHVLVERGIVDGFGHVSVRSAVDPQKFLLARSLAPALVVLEDIQTFDLDAKTEDARPSYLERFIHAEIYRARPDVQAVVHSHSEAIVPFSISSRRLRPVLHMAGFLHPFAPVFEIRSVSGEASDLLVRDAATGRALANALGDSAVALMRGHGATTVGRSLPEAVFRAVYAEVNAKAQATAAHLGTTIYLSEGEAQTSAETVAGQIHRDWDFWCDEVGRAQLTKQHREKGVQQ
jgi:ribulose-5-phosphate 4-epimerase/fuculose-1-phosphate aldolase